MQVHQDLNNLPLFKNAIVTIGTFDGVHSGHLRIIEQLKREANSINGETVIITFHPHPRMVINSARGNTNDGIQLLNTLPEKIELLEKQGIDHLVIVPFTLEFSEQPAEDYIKNFLVATFHPHSIIIGYDHRFGKDRRGDYKLLEFYQAEFGYLVKEIPEHVLHDIIISSTRIREALAKNEIAIANEYLGYDYFFEGEIIQGDKLGRTLGYPTANIEIIGKHKLIPGNGVYAVEILIEKISSGDPELRPTIFTGTKHLGMMNIGTRPTVGGTKRSIEVNIFDFDKMIYGNTARIFVKYFLRKEIKFNGLEVLKDQLARDKKNALALLGRH
jgi:riboflavin kinase/FMN adenylyltransferase